MAQCLPNLSCSQPSSSQRVSIANNSLYPRRFCYSWSAMPSKRNGYKSIKAMTSNGRHNLDHLQRANKPQTQQPRGRSPQVAPIGLWDRFPTARTVQQMMETMERLMEDPLSYNGQYSQPLTQTGGGYSRGRTPWEIKESEGEYKMRFDMPGMTKQDVKVYIEEKMLVVKAEKLGKKNGDDDDGGNGDDEWSAKSFGKYNLRIALPENVEFEKIKAEVKDGVLYITMPKAHTTSKILDINVE